MASTQAFDDGIFIREIQKVILDSTDEGREKIIQKAIKDFEIDIRKRVAVVALAVIESHVSIHRRGEILTIEILTAKTEKF